MKRSFLTVTDMFCGAGGSSQGAKHAGLEVSMASNHWKLAIETHSTNFPETEHDCADVSNVHPRRYRATDILIASPECTNHSLAKGQKRRAQKQEGLFGCDDCARFGERNCPNHSDAALRSRATMWDVPRFAEIHRYRIIIVENVVDAIDWECWDGWWLSMERLGYVGRCVFINSMFALPGENSPLPAAPQSRDRLYVVWWKKGNRAPNLSLSPLAFCGRCRTDVSAIQTFKPKASKKARYGRQYIYTCPRCKDAVKPYYYAALNAIDWTIPAERIGDRKRPLKERTLGRISYGLKKYGRRPLIVITNMTSDGGRSRPVTDPHFTQTGSNLTGVVSPVIIDTTYYGEGSGKHVYPGDGPLPSQTARLTAALVSPAAVMHMQGEGGWRVHGVDEHLSTQVASSAQDALLIPNTPFLVHTRRNDGADCRVRPSTEPLGTQTADRDFGVVVPPALLMTYRNQLGVGYRVRGLEEPTDTIVTNPQQRLIVPPFALLNLRDWTKVEQLVGGGDDPLPTQITAPQTAIAQRAPFLVSYYGNDQAAAIDEPIGTVTTKDRCALVAPEEDLRVEDCYFRMLRPHEIGRAMAFRDDYVVLGNDRDKVKQYGNAVTPPVMELLIRRCVESLHPEVAA